MTGFGFSKKEIFSITTDKNNTNNINKSKRLTLMRTVLQGGVRDQVGFQQGFGSAFFFFADSDPDPGKNLHADPDPGGIGGKGKK